MEIRCHGIQADLTCSEDRTRLPDAAPAMYGLVILAGDPAWFKASGDITGAWGPSCWRVKLDPHESATALAGLRGRMDELFTGFNGATGRAVLRTIRPFRGLHDVAFFDPADLWHILMPYYYGIIEEG